MDAVAAPGLAIPRVGKTVVVAVLMGVAIAFIGTVPWIAVIELNIRERPEWPWAAMTMGCWLGVLLVWLSGRGWPRRTSAFRQWHLRLWRPEPRAWSGDGLSAILGFVGAIAGLSVMYVLIGASRPPVDVSAYSIALRWSSLLMSPTVAGVVEEMAYRGYMQSHLERVGPTFAILATSVVFTLAHATQGLTYMLTLGPGIFLVSILYGYLAQKAGSIVPGMVLHVAGDLAFMYFVLTGGNAALLFTK
ncbi:MAG: lysostaphin resistance A-like protein [Vicinamibacterales bacterium]